MPLILLGLGIPFFAFAAAIFLAGFSQAHTAARGGQGTGGFWDAFFHDNVLAQLLGVAEKASRYVVAKFAGSQLKHLTRFFGALAFLTGETYKANAATAENAARAMERLHARERADVKTLHADQAHLRRELNSEVRTAEAQTRHVGKELHGFEAQTRPEIKALRHAIDVTLPRDIGRIRTREEALSRDQAKLRGRTTALEDGALDTWKWIRSHPRALATGAFAGAVAIALGRMGLGGLRCRNFRNLLGKFGCGLGTLLNDLLGIVVAGLVLESVCEFLPLVEDAFGAVAGPMVHLLNEVPLGDCETLPDGWAVLSVPHGPLPPAQTLGAFPG